MTPLKPHLVRALYDWILENHLTPHLLANAESEGVVVPTAFVQEGRIVLNLRPEAVNNLSLGDETVAFSARFGGKPMSVSIPMRAILAIYAQENGRGMVFDDDDHDEPPPPDEPEIPAEEAPVRKRPALRVVK